MWDGQISAFNLCVSGGGLWGLQVPALGRYDWVQQRAWFKHEGRSTAMQLNTRQLESKSINPENGLPLF